MSNLYPAIPEPTADVNSLLRTVQQLKEAVEMLTGQRGDADELDVGRRTRRLEATLDTADRDIRAVIASTERVLTDADSALAERTDAIEAEILDARSGEVDLNARIISVETVSVDAAGVANAAATEIVAARNGSPSLDAQLTTMRSATTSAAGAAADAQTTANAVFGGNTANALLRVESTANAGAAFSLVEFLARQSSGGTPRSAGLRIGANDTTGFVELTANQFFMSDPAWNGGARGNLLTWNGSRFVFGPPVLFNSSAQFGTAVVTTNAIAVEAATYVRFAETTANVGVSPTPVVTWTYTFNAPQDGPVALFFDANVVIPIGGASRATTQYALDHTNASGVVTSLLPSIKEYINPNNGSEVQPVITGRQFIVVQATAGNNTITVNTSEIGGSFFYAVVRQTIMLLGHVR